ncbi:MAG TPA: hypothetical protein PK323_06400 [Bacteroidia bacterium]|nr:hypothetical protein [Bacteroidia bacterium]
MEAKKNMANLCIKLRNGNVMSGLSKIENVVLNTNYGVLNIPVKDLNLIEFGIIASEKVKQKIAAYVDLLQSGNEADCQHTFKSLCNVEMNAIPVLESYLDKDNCAYPEYGVEAAYNYVKTLYGIENYIADDIITLVGDYRFPGVLDVSLMEIETEFGNLTIPREKIVSVEIVPDENAQNSVRNFKLEANQHISANLNGGWLKTNIKLNKGQKFSLEAKGEIIMASLSNQSHKPSGAYLPPGGAWTAGNDHDCNALPIFGNVVYRIGENGSMQKAGTKLSTTAVASGFLYLSIYETVFNVANSGNYNVKVVA